MMSLTPFHKFIITLVLSLILAGLSAGGFLWLWNEVKNSEFILQEIESKIASLEEERRQARAVEKILKEREADTERIRALSVDRERPVEFIESLERMAKETKNNLAINAEEAKTKTGELAFRIIIEGTGSSVLTYLKLIELAPYEIYVDEMAFEKISRELLLPVSQGGRTKTGMAAPTARLIFSLRVKTS